METSLILAQIMGPAMLVMGLSMALNAEAIRAMGEEFINSPALIYFSGFIALTYGLVIVTFHNMWVADWPGVITFLGWMFVAAGFVRIVMPGVVKALGEMMLGTAAKSTLIVGGAVFLALGGWITVMGYGLAG